MLTLPWRDTRRPTDAKHIVLILTAAGKLMYQYSDQKMARSICGNPETDLLAFGFINWLTKSFPPIMTATARTDVACFAASGRHHNEARSVLQGWFPGGRR